MLHFKLILLKKKYIYQKCFKIRSKTFIYIMYNNNYVLIILTSKIGTK